MTPEEAKSWIDTAWSYGPFAFLFFATAVLYFFGFTISKRRKGKTEEGVIAERRAPVQIECPAAIIMEGIKDDMHESVRQQGRMLEMHKESIRLLDILVQLHIGPRRGDTSTHERVRRESIPGT
jgi:hypothetical protein